MTTEKRMQLVAWSLGSLVALLAFSVWAQVRLIHGNPLTTYDIFPIFGLLAFSLMWTQYVLSAASSHLQIKWSVLRRYYKVTGWLILTLILLHPGTLITKLWLDGFGPPPLSYLQVYDTTLQRFALILGTTSVLIFLSYELHRKFGHRSWWKYVNYANMAAMFAIFVHALTLGDELGVLWFKLLWFFYGATLLVAVMYSLRKEGAKT